MCGIFGFIKTNNLQSKELIDYTNTLFKLTEPRGRQASGISILANDEIQCFKRPETATKVINSNLYKNFTNKAFESSAGPIAVLGHCRLVTDGSELESVNNQPIFLNKIVGVHNGVINNFERIKDQNKLKIKGSSDSEVVFKYIEKKLEDGLVPGSAIMALFEQIRGSASIAALYSDYSKLTISTNFGSLYFSFANDDFFIFASEEKIVDSFLKKYKFNSKATQLSSGVTKEISLSNLQTKDYAILKNKNETEEKINKDKDFSQSIFNIIDMSPNPKNIKRCTKCILPINYPFLSLDKDGVCNICKKYQMQKFKGKDELSRYFDKYRSKNGEPDCLIGLSGGRDSSYGLHVLKKEFGMNPVGFAYDWLLTSRKARHNIAKMSGALDVEVIYRCGNYETQAKNIRDNINGFLKDPDLGMMTFVQASDKEMYHYGREVRKDKKLDLTVWCSGYQLEQREFIVGYCGINKTLINNQRLYDYGWITKLRLAVYYGLKTLKNPLYWNRSIYDNAMAFWHCFVAKDDFLYLFDYFPWKEQEVERVLEEDYGWEADRTYGVNQWRMDDFHTSFINYVYYTVGGFSEFDDFRSNQIREGLISREEALRLTAIDNNIRYEALREFSSLVGFNLEHVLKKIDAIPKLYL